MRAVLIAGRIVLTALWLGLTASVAAAQDAVDSDEWLTISSQIEALLDRDELPNVTLNEIRGVAVEWRDRFAEGEDINAAQIETIRTQIDALGPPPAEGEAEAEEIAARRTELNEALATARAPQIAAAAALAEANSLIGRIDTRFRAQQADAFLQLVPSPLLPTQWASGVADVYSKARQIREEAWENLAALSDQREIARRVPLSVLLLVIAIVLIVRGPRATDRMVSRIEHQSGEQGRVVYGFLASLGGVAFPLMGVTLIYAALVSTGILGEVGQAAALGVNIAIIFFSVSRSLGNRLFPVHDITPTPIVLSEEKRAYGRLLSRLAGLLVGLLILIETIDNVDGADPERVSVIAFPFLVALGFALFELGRLARAGRPDIEDDTGFAGYLLGTSGRALQAVGIFGPIAAAIGYYNMAFGLLVPTTLTLAVGSFLATFHYVLRATYGLVLGLTAEEAEEALVPVLTSVTLTFLLTPLVSLFWGVRTADLAEVWTRFKAGIRVGETTISPGDFLTIVVVFAIGFGLTRLIQGLLRSTVLPRTKLDKGGQNAVISGLGYVGISLAVVAAITVAGIDLSALAIVIGALGVGIGFGLQNIVNNFVSGIILLIERPIGEGDWVDVNGNFGVVKSISVRSTVIETFDRTDVIVPNGDLVSGVVTNWTRGNSIGRAIVPVGVAYGTDTRKVERILKEVAEAHPIVAVNPPPTVLFRGFGADSLDFEIRAILTDVSYVMAVRSDMNHEIARRFAEEGVEIPFAQRDIWLRNPEALRENGTRPAVPLPPEAPERREADPPDVGLVQPESGEADGDR